MFIPCGPSPGNEKRNWNSVGNPMEIRWYSKFRRNTDLEAKCHLGGSLGGSWSKAQLKAKLARIECNLIIRNC